MSRRPMHFAGAGMLKGMVVTARNMILSYFDREHLVTVQYPEENAPMSEHARILPFLVHDGDDPIAGLRCVACRICEKECPPSAIHIVEQRDEKGKVTKHPEVFEIDASVCMGCQICVEVCPFDSIKMDQVNEFATFGRTNELKVGKARLAKSNTYFHKIHPTEAAEVDARLAAKKKPAK